MRSSQLSRPSLPFPRVHTGSLLPASGLYSGRWSCLCSVTRETPLLWASAFSLCPWGASRRLTTQSILLTPFAGLQLSCSLSSEPAQGSHTWPSWVSTACRHSCPRACPCLLCGSFLVTCLLGPNSHACNTRRSTGPSHGPHHSASP